MIGAIIQARMSSKRLPGKVLRPVQGKPILQYLLESLAQCKKLGTTVVATSVEPTDDPVEQFCWEYGIPCYRGPLADVAGRFVEVVKKYDFNAFVRLNGDSPLLDYRLVDQAIFIYCSGDYDIATNVLRRTYPKGQSIEVIKSKVFLDVYPLMLKKSEREHVTSYFYTHKNDFNIGSLEYGKNYGEIQLSVDTMEDLKRFESIIGSMEKPQWEHTFDEIINFLSVV